MTTGATRAEIPEGLVERLVCPKCRGELERFQVSELRCLRCRLGFRVVGGIPVMLVDEARIV